MSKRYQRELRLLNLETAKQLEMVTALGEQVGRAMAAALGEQVGRAMAEVGEEAGRAMGAVLLVWRTKKVTSLQHEGSPLTREKTSPRNSPFPIRAIFSSFCSICTRNKETKAMIAEILHAHDEQLQIHPRTKWWRIWIHCFAVVSLIWHLHIAKFYGWPLRLFDQLGGVVKKFRLP